MNIKIFLVSLLVVLTIVGISGCTDQNSVTNNSSNSSNPNPTYEPVNNPTSNNSSPPSQPNTDRHESGVPI
jgi:hypothetical protein